MRDPRRWMVLLAAAWLGALLALAAIGTPAPFATLPRPEAGRVVAPMLANEARLSLLLGAVLMLLQRVDVRRRLRAGEPTRAFDGRLALAAGALFCTVLGYYALQPQMAAVRAGQPSPLSFGQWHALSAVFYAIKCVLVAALAWRLSRPSSSSR